ncbi:MAG: ATP-binding cassette domain-containing protein [Ruminococcus sp.]|nr:ATP-binding cassette domain-containing protein [Ruminococcus sp.]
MEILSCKELNFSYNGSDRQTLCGVSFGVQRSQVVLVVGRTGSGKSTLLRLLKKEIAPVGKLAGEIKVNGKAQRDLTLLESTQLISYVSQNPQTQTVTHNVSSELAFGLESLGIGKDEILGRVGEMAAYFGIEDIYSKSIDELSGGQKQLCCLCAAVVQSPQILLLDEPAAQLDPIGKGKLFSVLRRLNSELGTTLIIAEHDVQGAFEFCDKIIVLDGGRAVCYDDRESFLRAAAADEGLRGYIPACARAVMPLGRTAFNVRQAKEMIEQVFRREDTKAPDEKSVRSDKAQYAVTARNVYFRYSREDRDVARCLDLNVRKGEIFALVGSNGSGKTTLLKVLSGILKPWQGKVTIGRKNIKAYKGNSLYRENAAVMPQDPYDLFTSQSVRNELDKTCRDMNEKGGYDELCAQFGIGGLLDMHPFDLSGGEIQKCAMVKLLLTKPQVLLLDEPSKALDPQAKAVLGQALQSLSQQGRTVIIATHDLDFAAQYAHTCALFFDGKAHSCAQSREFFARNNFYTTDSSRIARNVFPGAVTVQELEAAVRSGDRL